jgi:multiple sugar transport system substrate-binding protein
MKRITKLALAAALTALAAASQAGTITYNASIHGPNQKDAFQALIDDFEKANPDIKVKVSYIDAEGYKVQLPNWLQAESPDLINWYAGERMRYYVRRGLLEDVSDLWKKNGWTEQFASTTKSASLNGKFYALPYMYYSWGIHYRKDLMEKAGVTAEPKTWPQFLDACKKLKASGVAPVVSGGKDGWNLAGWFDYMNLRTNGYEFQIDLTDGKIPYTDARVKKTFTNWKTALDAGCFVDNMTSYDYQTAQPLLYTGKAAMFLMGTFMAPGFPADVKDKMGYMQFPEIDAKVKRAEDGPTDTFHIPAKAKNKADARKFLEFAAKPENVAKLAKGMGSLPTNSKSTPPTDPLEKTSFDILSGATGGVAQFYDRDAVKEMADEGMKGMQEFLSKPERLDDILARLEKARQRIHKAK